MIIVQMAPGGKQPWMYSTHGRHLSPVTRRQKNTQRDYAVTPPLTTNLLRGGGGGGDTLKIAPHYGKKGGDNDIII